MLKTFKFAVGAALIAATQLAIAATAEVKISNLTFTNSGGEWWSYVPGLDENGNWPNWVAPASGAMTGFNAPLVEDAVSGWQGQTLNSSLTAGTSHAQASVLGQTVGNLNGVSAFASVNAQDGQSGWAYANVFYGQLLVSKGGTVTVSFAVDKLQASGSEAQANASIQFCSTDFTTDTCEPAHYAEAFVDASSPGYTVPTILTASWTNTNTTENMWAKMRIGLTASASSVSPVPEPTTTALWLAGLAAGGAIAHRRRRS